MALEVEHGLAIDFADGGARLETNLAERLSDLGNLKTGHRDHEGREPRWPQ
jgi:hypothetical protein